MTFKKTPFSSRRKKLNIDKEVVRNINETKRRMKEKIVNSKMKKENDEE
ncbi:MAG: hypothetical protein JSV04_12200 [Candidatus Heimdallarchaeota archaeon]|nr:MAG: hypothetical protein JSV04_12200 [Candidatus Heimdallarchaeota archaeon]